MTDTTTADISIAVDRCVAVITLSRTRSLNALTAEMRRRIADAVPAFARDPQVYAVLLQSTSPKAFSAGSDVREILGLRAQSRDAARKAFVDEYSMNWLLECFSKPTISLINGMVMGGGVGITGFNTHRVAGENYSWAMPETLIGLFPDVGAMHALARMGSTGAYLALTGRSVRRADAFRLGLATHCIGERQFARIAEELALANPVDPLLDDLHEDCHDAEPLAEFQDVIDNAFSASTVEDIVSRLRAGQGPKRAWAHEVAADLERRSPMSLKVSHRFLKEAAAFDIRQTLSMDYRLACRFLDGPDFAEGVRAALIDKDGKPAWRPTRLQDVTPAMVDAYFAPLPAGEDLILPPREDMQKARV